MYMKMSSHFCHLYIQVSATFYTLFRLQLGEFYRVAAYHQTTPDNLVTNALFLARFAPALVQVYIELTQVFKNVENWC